MATKMPQDHQSADEFVFHVNGKRHTLPLVTDVELEGAELMDSMLGGEAGQLSYLFRKLRGANSPKAVAALRGLPESEMLQVLKDWGEHGDGDGASLGE